MSFDNHCSRVLKYAKVWDKPIKLAPTASILGRINASLLARNSSINTSDMLHSLRHKKFNKYDKVSSFIEAFLSSIALGC